MTASAVRRRAAHRHAPAAWVPQQHGAWAMLLVPLVVGSVLRLRVGSGGHLLALAVTWVLGYVAFNAASLWLKAASAKRHRYTPAALVYGSATAVAGVATLLLTGPALTLWVLAYAPLLATALWLAWRRHERSWLSGLLTVVAACLMCLVAAVPNPGRLAADPHVAAVVTVTVALFGYFFGTVLYVKTMIRERGDRGWWAISIGWHAAWTVLAALASVAGLAGWWWTAFFAATVVRSIALPLIARYRPVRPRLVGIIEIVFSAAALAASLAV